jgi:HEAT repeat protein
MKGKAELEAIFDADRRAREAEQRLLSMPDAAVTELLSDAVRKELASERRRDAVARLERLADLCAQVGGPEMADALIQILNDDEPSVRVAAGEALLDLAYDRYAEVAHAIERALDRGTRGPAMAELPWVVAEVAEPSALALIRRFLEHPEADAIAAAIESLAEVGDPAATEWIRKFVGDPREVSMDDFEEETSATLGELAEAAIEALESGPPEQNEK